MVVFEILKNIILAPLELVFEVIFTLAFNATHSEGLAIIILSLTVSTLVLPLYKRAEKIESEQRAIEKKLSYWANHIKKHFKGDLKYMTLDAYYRENHYSPLSQLKSSISILLQIPFFMAAYDLLGIRAAARFSGRGFSFLSDLGSPDGLLSVGDTAINVLPFLMTLVNIVACYIYTKGFPFKTAFRSYLLAIVFLIFLYNSPSALLLYWTMNNVYSLIKTIILKNAGQSRTRSKIIPSRDSAVAKIGIILPTQANTGLFVLTALFMSVLTGLLIPLNYLSTSPAEFINFAAPQNPLCYLLSSFFVAAGFFVLWPGVFYYLANKKSRLIISVLAFGIAVFSIVDYLFFGTDTGTLDTILVFDIAPSYTPVDKIINIVVLLLIFAGCILLYRFRKALRFVFCAAIMALLTVSAINAKKIQDTYVMVTSRFDAYQEIVAPKITLSAEGENVMVIMLDKAVSGYIPYIFYEFPELEEQFDGFVYYPNTMSFGQNTLKASSALFGGYEYTPDRMDARAGETLASKHDEALTIMPKLFSEKGYITTLMELPFVGWSWHGDYSAFEEIDNCYAYYPLDYYNQNTEGNVNAENRRNRNLFMYSIFKCSPLLLQETVYDNGSYLSVSGDAYNKYDVLENYKVLENFDEMTQINNDYPGGLFIIDNETTHDVTTLNNYDPYDQSPFTDEFYISNGNDELLIWHQYQAGTYECLVAAMLELGDYMDYLKEIGVYDNTRIIIVSDHGTSVGLFKDLIFYDVNAEWYNCLLMVKDYDSTGFTTDYTFMTNADVPVIAMEGIIDDPMNPYTGNPINTDLKYGDLYVDYSLNHNEELWNPDVTNGNVFFYDNDCTWFKVVNSNIFEEDNWILTDKPN